MWSLSPAPDAKTFLQGLIQLSAAMVKRREGNRDGEAKLLASALEKLSAVHGRAGEVFLGVRLQTLIEQIKKHDTTEIVLEL